MLIAHSHPKIRRYLKTRFSAFLTRFRCTHCDEYIVSVPVLDADFQTNFLSDVEAYCCHRLSN